MKRHPMLRINLYVGLFCILIIFGVTILGFLPKGNIDYPVLFVSRQIPCCGSVYMSEANALPGVGGFSKYQIAAPGYLCILFPDGKIDTLIDGSNPTTESLYLIDVTAPAIHWDANKIVFAGLPEGNYETGNNNQISKEHNAWRLYTINVDGTGLKQLTGLKDIPGSDQALDLSQFNLLAQGSLAGYDDTDPVWLPDGRICFSSTRFPTLAMYNATRTSNLYVVNEDGTDLHRITAEKNGADRPVVDPITGKIVFARWWRNFYWPYDGMESVPSDQYPQGWRYHNGMTSDLYSVIDNEYYMFNNNAFALSEINPDGSDLQLHSAYYRQTSNNSCYGGSFDLNGDFVGVWYPIEHITESSGFGGIKRYFRKGKKQPQGLIGITEYGNLDYYIENPPSYGILKGQYATEPFVMEDGRILFSMAPTPKQDYGLYIMDHDGLNVIPLLDIPNMTELRAQLVRPRPRPPIIEDSHTGLTSLLPPLGMDDLRKDGSFVFDCRNIFFNAPVDDPIISAPKVGDVGTVRFFAAPLMNQQYGSIEALDFPLLYNEIGVDPFGRVLEVDAPANVPLFEQARAPQTAGYHIPRTGGGIMDGAAQVMGFNYGRAGQQVTCVGCHSGHSTIPVPQTAEELFFTNLAPGASITASSSMNAPGYAIDRKNFTAQGKHWFSAENANPNEQWLKLKWLVPIHAKEIVLHNVPKGFNVNINSVQVSLYSDSAGTNTIFSQSIIGPLSDTGTVLSLPEILKIQSMRVEFLECTGGIYHWDCATIGDIEVIASHVEPAMFSLINDCKGIAYGPHKVDTCGQCLLPNDPLFNDCLSEVNDEGPLDSFIKVWPVPSKEFIHVDFSIQDTIFYEVFNLNGKRMAIGKFHTTENVLDVRHLPAGTYFLKVEKSAQRPVFKRFIVLR